MADDPGGSRPTSPDHSEVDSVMNEEVNQIPTTAMNGDAAREAMKAYQRQAAQTLLTRSVSQKESISVQDDDASEISHLTSSTKPIDDAQAIQFSKLKKKYLEKKKKGTLSIDEDIAFMKAQSAETARQRKMRQDAEFDDPFIPEPAAENEEEDDTLFLQDTVPDLPNFESDKEEPQSKKRGRKRKRAVGDGDNEPQPETAKKPKKSRKVSGHDYTDGDLESILSKKKKSSKEPSSKKTKKKAKQGPSMTDTRNLWYVSPL